MNSFLILLSLMSLCLAANNSYFTTPEITYSTPSGRPGNENLNKVYFNVTDAQYGGTADCHYFWALGVPAPNKTSPAICSDTTFSWYFGSDSTVDDFDIEIKHEVQGKCVHGLSPVYKTDSPGASYECGGSGACFFAVDGTENEPLKIYFA